MGDPGGARDVTGIRERIAGYLSQVAELQGRVFAVVYPESVKPDLPMAIYSVTDGGDGIFAAEGYRQTEVEFEVAIYARSVTEAEAILKYCRKAVGNKLIGVEQQADEWIGDFNAYRVAETWTMLV